MALRNRSGELEDTVSPPKISYSQLSEFGKCGYKYYLMYVDPDRIRPQKGLWAPLGSAVHHSIQKNLEAKMAGVELKNHDLRAREEYDRLVEHEDYEVPQGEDASRAHSEARSMAIRLAELHAQKVAPAIFPYLVEVKFELPRDDYILVGVIDVVEKVGSPGDPGLGVPDLLIYQIRDTKTSVKVPDKEAAERSLQLRLYADACREAEGVTPSFAVMDVLMKTNHPVHHQRVTAITDAELDVVGRRIEALLLARERGVFPPAPEGAWYCSKKHCGFWDSCPYALRPASVGLTQIGGS